jgi:hypothetical protein
MANQYSGSLEHKVKTKFGCSARELLEQFAEEDLSYIEVQSRLGVTQGTVRKWAKRFNIEFRSDGFDEVVDDQRDLFFAPEINIVNLLSRKWSHAS